MEIEWVFDVDSGGSIEVDPEDVDTVKALAVQSARQAGEILEFRCPVDAEAKSGKTWYCVH